jgi:hypothetical protein
MKLSYRWIGWSCLWTRGQVWFLALWTCAWLAGLGYVTHRFWQERDENMRLNWIILSHGGKGDALW